jgi:large subunit ribosomal protein L29
MSMHKYIRDQKLRDKSVAELKARAGELKTQLFTHRFNKATGKLDNYRLMPATRRQLAAVLTLLREKELAAVKEAK